MCSRAQSMMNQIRTWMRKTEIGSHRKRKNTAHADKQPNSMHSDSGSKKMVWGHIADRNFVHLKN